MPKTPEQIAAEKAAADKAAADKAAADKAAADKAAADAANGFPSETPVDDMTPEQQVAYWKHQARKHEKSDKSKSDYEDLKAKAAELATLKAATATEQEKAVDEARREGENIGAERYLKDAVKGYFRAATGKSNDEVDKAFEHIDAKSFVDGQGNVDVEKLEEFAKSFASETSDTSHQSDPVKAAIERQRQGGGGSGSGSVEEIRKARLEKLQPSKQ